MLGLVSGHGFSRAEPQPKGAKKERGYLGEVWQRGFSESRVADRESFRKHKEYIAANPVRAGLAESSEDYPYCFTYLVKRKAAAAKAG